MKTEFDFDTIGCMLDKDSAKVIYSHLKKIKTVAGCLVETGTGWGHSSKFFSKVLPVTWRIFTVDAFGLYGDGRIYNSFDQAQVKKILDEHPANVIQILSDSKKVPWFMKIDVLYLDADHTEEGCRADFENFGPWVKPGGLVIFDDYIQENNPANGVKKVVDSLQGYEVLYTGIAAILRKL